MRNITSMADEQLAVGDGIFEFRNPQLYKTGYSNCRYFLIYTVLFQQGNIRQAQKVIYSGD